MSLHPRLKHYRIAGLARQAVFKPRPLVISPHLPVHPESAQKSGYKHILLIVNSRYQRVILRVCNLSIG